MNRCTTTVFTLTILYAMSVAAQDMPSMPAPVKEHEWLKKFVGEWTTNSKGSMGPGQPPMEVSGTLKCYMLGGHWLINEMKGDMMGTQMTGIQSIGFDTDKKKYTGTWIDSMSSFMWRYEGTVDKSGKILTLEADGPNFMVAGKMTKFQDIYEFKSDDEMVVVNKMMTEDGKWMTFMNGTATRKKPGG